MVEYEVIIEQRVPSIVAKIKEAIKDKYEDVETGADEVLALVTKKRLTASERDAVEAILGRKIALRKAAEEGEAI